MCRTDFCLEVVTCFSQCKKMVSLNKSELDIMSLHLKQPDFANEPPNYFKLL